MLKKLRPAVDLMAFKSRTLKVKEYYSPQNISTIKYLFMNNA
jgi:hypothetical protein